METTVVCNKKHKKELKELAMEVGGNSALVISGIVVAPIIAFAALWTSLLVIIGGAAILHWAFGF